VVRAFGEAKAAATDFASSMPAAIGSAASAVVNDLSNVALAQGKISFSAQHAQVREFEAATAHMAVAAKQDLESVRAAAEATGAAIGRRPSEVIAWEQSVTRLTYNFEGAQKSVKGFAQIAATTGRSLDDYKELAAVMGNFGAVTGDSSKALGALQQQAEMMHTRGGIAAFADQVGSLGEVISHFAIKSEQDFLRVTAGAAALGKGLDPVSAQRVTSRALGFLSGNVIAHERYLGHHITNAQGKIENPMETLLELRDKVKRQYGADRERNMLATMMGGDVEAASALMGVDRAELGKLGGAKASGALPAALQQYMGTDAGHRDVAQAELAKSANHLLGSSSALGHAADALQQFAAHNPISSTVISTAISTSLGGFMSSLGKTLSGSGGVGAGAGGIGGTTAALGISGAVLAAGLYGIDEWDQAAQERHKLQEHERDVGAQGALKNKLIAVHRVTAALHASGLAGADYHDAQEAANKVTQSKDAMAALQFSHGGGDALQALVAELRKEGRSEADAEKLARAVAAALKQEGAVKVEVKQGPDTPPLVVTKTSHSKHAGHQG
jgi:hypothetical protein